MQKILILGIGNLLWADEGFGVRVVEQLSQRYVFPDHVTVMDGGTQGMFLLPYVQESDKLLIIDAIDYNLSPGTIKIVYDQAVPCFTGAKKMSVHQTGFQEVLAAAQLTNQYPQALVLIGVQPQTLDYGGDLSATVRNQIETVITFTLQHLAQWHVYPCNSADEYH